MRLRDADVLARVDADGNPEAKSGRVEIRYQPKGKAYHAAAANLSPIEGAALLPDEHCAETDDAPSKSTTAAATKGAKAASRTGSWSAGPTKAAALAQGATKAPDDAVIAYADGACSGNPGPAGLGLVVIDESRVLQRSEYLGHATNNIAELTAIKRAIEAVPDVKRALWIYTDSQYSIGVLTKGWKPKANQELIAELKALLAKRPGVHFVYVPGHAGVALNEKADELARTAVTDRRTTESAKPLEAAPKAD